MVLLEEPRELVGKPPLRLVVVLDDEGRLGAHGGPARRRSRVADSRHGDRGESHEKSCSGNPESHDASVGSRACLVDAYCWSLCSKILLRCGFAQAPPCGRLARLLEGHARRRAARDRLDLGLRERRKDAQSEGRRSLRVVDEGDPDLDVRRPLRRLPGRPAVWYVRSADFATRTTSSTVRRGFFRSVEDLRIGVLHEDEAFVAFGPRRVQQLLGARHPAQPIPVAHARIGGGGAGRREKRREERVRVPLERQRHPVRERGDDRALHARFAAGGAAERHLRRREQRGPVRDGQAEPALREVRAVLLAKLVLALELEGECVRPRPRCLHRPSLVRPAAAGRSRGRPQRFPLAPVEPRSGGILEHDLRRGQRAIRVRGRLHMHAVADFQVGRCECLIAFADRRRRRDRRGLRPGGARVHHGDRRVRDCGNGTFELLRLTAGRIAILEHDLRRGQRTVRVRGRLHVHAVADLQVLRGERRVAHPDDRGLRDRGRLRLGGARVHHGDRRVRNGGDGTFELHRLAAAMNRRLPLLQVDHDRRHGSADDHVGVDSVSARERQLHVPVGESHERELARGVCDRRFVDERRPAQGAGDRRLPGRRHGDSRRRCACKVTDRHDLAAEGTFSRRGPGHRVLPV